MVQKKIPFILNIIIFMLSFIGLWISFSLFLLIVCILSGIEISFLIDFPKPVVEEDKKEVEEHREELPKEEDSDFQFPPNFNEKEFVKNMFLLYRDIQTNFMNFEYDTLRNQLGIEMYEQFSKQMKHLEDNGRQSVRKNIDLQKIQLMSFKQEKEEDIAIVKLAVLEDKYMKKIEEDFRLTSARVRYESCYSLTVVKHHRKKIVRKCHQCNEKVVGNPAICPNCNAMLLENTETWILKDLQLVCSHSYKEKKES